MSLNKKLGIIGAGYAARCIARRFMYDMDVSVITAGRYQLDNTARMNMALDRLTEDEETIFRLSDLVNVHVEAVMQGQKNKDGQYQVVDSHGKEYHFDELVIATGSRVGHHSRVLFRELRPEVYTSYFTMQALRLKNNANRFKGKILIVSGGSESRCLFNAIIVELS